MFKVTFFDFKERTTCGQRRIFLECAFCEFNNYEIAGEYEDAGKSGKTIEGRVAFNQMMYDKMNEAEKRDSLEQLI